MAFATALVPAPNWSNSNTPTGPFQTTVPAFIIISTSTCADFEPISKIMSSAATSVAFLFTAGSFSSNFLPQTTSSAMGILAPRLDILSINVRAVGTKSSSHSDFPTSKPAAFKKVLAMPPPTTI